MESFVLETGIDKLIKLVKERGQIGLEDASKELGVSKAVIQEWVDFLGEGSVIDIKHSLTKHYLIERNLAQNEFKSRANEFANKKEAFARKADSSLNFLEKQAEELRTVKGEFDALKNKLGLEIDTVRSNLRELEQYQQLKEEMQSKAEEQKKGSIANIKELTSRIISGKKQYDNLVSYIKEECKELNKKNTEAMSMEKDMAKLNKQLAGAKELISLMEKRSIANGNSIKNFESRMIELRNMANELKRQAVEEKTNKVFSLEKTRGEERKLLELNSNILEKISKNRKNISNASNMIKNVNEFFEKKLFAVNLVDKLDIEYGSLKKDMTDIIKMAKSFQLNAKNNNIDKQLVELEGKFEHMNKKKNIFVNDVKRLFLLLNRSKNTKI